LRIPIIGGTYELEAKAADGERTVNWYPELVEAPAGKSSIRLVPTPGRKLLCTLPDQPVRGLLAGNKRLFAVAGAKLCEVFEDGSFTVLGDVGNGPNPVRMVLNGNSIFITSEGQGYLANGVVVVPVVPASTGTFIDGYYIASTPNSKQYRISLDGAAWDPLDVADKEGYPDYIAALLADHRLLWIFGFDSIEVHQDTGAALFPFERIDAAFIEQGVASPWAIAILPTGPAWLGSTARGQSVVWRADGYQPVRISNHAIEDAIASFARLDDAEFFSYEDHGHFFLVCHFPSAERSFVYDALLPREIAWHERGLWSPQRGRYQLDRARCHAFVWNKHFVGDFASGKIYQQSPEFLDDAGAPLRRMRITPHISRENKFLSHRELEVEVERGVGLDVAADQPGYDPKIVMRMSNDGGKTWGNEHQRSLGRLGEYRTRVHWHRLGRARDRVYEFTVSDPCRATLIDGYAEVA